MIATKGEFTVIKMSVKGNFKNTEKFFANSKNIGQRFRNIMEKYGERGVEALRLATPKDSGLTSESWYYTVENWGLAFCNKNINEGVPIAVIIQYGHGTKTGGYIQGTDYINPALRPIFDQILSDCEKEVKNL